MLRHILIYLAMLVFLSILNLILPFLNLDITEIIIVPFAVIFFNLLFDRLVSKENK